MRNDDTVDGKKGSAYSLKTSSYSYSRVHLPTPSLLENLYLSFQQSPKMQQKFNTSIRNAAQSHNTKIEKNVKLDKKTKLEKKVKLDKRIRTINFPDFKRVIKKLNPDLKNDVDIKKFLAKVYAHNKKKLINRSLTTERLNNEHLRVMSRQGSQQQGVIPVRVWNHWGSPDLYNWTNYNPISNVMDSASDAVSALKKKNLKSNKIKLGARLKKNKRMAKVKKDLARAKKIFLYRLNQRKITRTKMNIAKKAQQKKTRTAPRPSMRP